MQDRRLQLNEERLTHQVSVQAEQIERVFSQHQVSARIERGTIRPNAIQFDLQAQLSAGWERVRAITEDLIRALGVADVNLREQDGRWQLEVARPEEPAVPLLDLLTMVDEIGPATAVLGLSEKGKPLMIDFKRPDTNHLLVSGDADAGKSVLLRTLAVSLALNNRQRDLQLLVLSGGQVSPWLTRLSYLPHMLEEVVESPEDAALVLQFLVDELAYRQEQESCEPRLVVLIDQVVTLMDRLSPSAETAIHRLVQHGGRNGIHLVLSTREPNSPLLSSTLRLNLPTRLIGRTADRRMASLLSDGRDLQADYLLGEGDFIACSGRHVSHFQAGLVGDYDLHMRLTELRRGQRVLLARPYNMRVHMEPLDSEPSIFEAPRPPKVVVEEPIADAREDAATSAETSAGNTHSFAYPTPALDQTVHEQGPVWVDEDEVDEELAVFEQLAKLEADSAEIDEVAPEVDEPEVVEAEPKPAPPPVQSSPARPASSAPPPSNGNQHGGYRNGSERSSASRVTYKRRQPQRSPNPNGNGSRSRPRPVFKPKPKPTSSQPSLLIDDDEIPFE